ncbi:uncharacterized protein ATNIH1004_009586 [Aspergillus tanneri]|uniref:Uncharacterized protein n=1 Tax=Aspergillus tanneri TaxID=1220188 RepID=A0A5M9MD14_9EURO|nr:uncharacterized protein ATNIH1004_009586 [Aspergillus tanneri]KAA8642833.1 hypothetical protein ATNIH1004_009586 [Aspergillus tanneri]
MLNQQPMLPDRNGRLQTVSEKPMVLQKGWRASVAKEKSLISGVAMTRGSVNRSCVGRKSAEQMNVRRCTRPDKTQIESILDETVQRRNAQVQAQSEKQILDAAASDGVRDGRECSAH